KALSSTTLMNGRLSIKAFTIAGVMCGSARRSFSAATFGSTSPFPTCAPALATIDSMRASAPRTTPHEWFLIISSLQRLRGVQRWMPVRVCQSDKAELHHEARRQHRRRLGAHHLLDNLPAAL